MYKKIIVYDGYNISKQEDGREFLRLKLEPLLTNLRREWKERDCPTEIQDALFKCPAFVRSLKNTFVYKCPYDLEVEYDSNKKWQISFANPHLLSDHNSKNVMASGLEDNHVVQLFSGDGSRLFFADKPCEMVLEQPYFHRQDLVSLSGCFDIGRWFRPVHPAIINFGQKDFKIKRGEPLLYLRFPKDAKIEFRRTVLDDDLRRLSNGTSGYKSFKYMATFKELYEYFETAVNKKRILKKLEKNRID
tara:strand:- start:4483 stop:5223 length:741 start_codon:yes stop_codon:yes gene_type:complete